MTMTRKLGIMSDLHFDINDFSEKEWIIFEKLLSQLGLTDLHFAGDMSNDLKGLTLPNLAEFEERTGLSVTYNLGNHDMIGLSEEELSDRDFQVKYFGDTAFLSFAGWYDYSFMTEENFDPARIARFKHNFYFDRKIKHGKDDIKTTQKILQNLEEKLESLKDVPRLIIAMHFVPERSFIIDTRYEKFARFNAYLGSQHFHELFKKYANISDVIFGHIHHRMSPQEIDGIKYHARGLGYPYEWHMVENFLRDFPQYYDKKNPRWRKCYFAIKDLAEWKEYRLEHLKEELEDSLTIFEF